METSVLFKKQEKRRDNPSFFSGFFKKGIAFQHR